MQNTLLNFLKKNWLYVLLVCIVFFIGFKLFYSNKTIDTLNQSIIEKQYENKLLNEQLKNQKQFSEVLQKKVDSIYAKWISTPPQVIIKTIKEKNEAARTNIINADTDEQLRILSNWLSKESNGK